MHIAGAINETPTLELLIGARTVVTHITCARFAIVTVVALSDAKPALA